MSVKNVIRKNPSSATQNKNKNKNKNNHRHKKLFEDDADVLRQYNSTVKGNKLTADVNLR